ncbi:MAG: response regulator [Anaerolineales bacterium]|nr:response regulator [Anaerolineales bacterium]
MSSAAAARKKILIVEDVEFNLDLLVQLLEDEYQLVSAGDGQAGIELASRERPDLILMDMSLPGLNGWEATRRIKSDLALAHIPIIGLSAHALRAERDQAMEAGCDEYLTKPVDEELLFAAIRRTFGAP